MGFPSTFQDIQTAVIKKARLDSPADVQAVKDWINQTYAQVCLEGELIVSSTTTITLTANVGNAALPAGVKRIASMFVTPAGASSSQQQPPLTRTTLDDILWRRSNGGIAATPGQYPRYFTLDTPGTIELWPTPAAADVLTLYAIGLPTPLAAAGDLPVIDEPYASKLLEYGALVQAGDFKGDPGTYDWQNDFDMWMARWLNHLEEQKGDIPAQFHQWGTLADTKNLYGW